MIYKIQDFQDPSQKPESHFVRKSKWPKPKLQLIEAYQYKIKYSDVYKPKMVYCNELEANPF